MNTAVIEKMLSEHDANEAARACAQQATPDAAELVQCIEAWGVLSEPEVWALVGPNARVVRDGKIDMLFSGLYPIMFWLPTDAAGAEIRVADEHGVWVGTPMVAFDLATPEQSRVWVLEAVAKAVRSARPEVHIID